MSDLTEAGAYFCLVIQLLQLFSENKADFTKVTSIFGICYKICDDYRNIFRQEVISELLVLDI
jgi:hypothetical protein